MSKTIDTFLPFKQMLIPKERHAKKAPFGMSPEGLTIHEVDNNASAYNEVFFMGFNPSNINREVSYHIAVDEKEAIQGIPFTRNAWHAGDGLTGFGNRSTIGMEIARNYADRATYVKARTNAEIVAGWLCFLYSWTEKDIYTHYDHSRKNCPRNIIADGYMDTFKKNAMKYKAIFAGQTDPVPNPTPTPDLDYKVGETIYYKGRVHANSMGARAGSVINGNFKIDIVNNNPYGVHLAGKGWVRPSDIGKEVIQEKPGQIKVGDIVNYNGRVYGDSKGNKRGASIKGTYTVTIVNDNSHGVHLGNIGWVKKSDLTKGTTPKKTIEQMAREVSDGIHGNGHDKRQKSLGVDDATYQKVRALVNKWS